MATPLPCRSETWLTSRAWCPASRPGPCWVCLRPGRTRSLSARTSFRSRICSRFLHHELPLLYYLNSSCKPCTGSSSGGSSGRHTAPPRRGTRSSHRPRTCCHLPRQASQIGRRTTLSVREQVAETAAGVWPHGFKHTDDSNMCIPRPDLSPELQTWSGQLLTWHLGWYPIGLNISKAASCSHSNRLNLFLWASPSH